ncbi:hypothetical protein B9Z55_018369 [Caenorhabditis nigoni]|nr:hypothetical protein B9Z55_018369 [Caenorhabditis nigoni]
MSPVLTTPKPLRCETNCTFQAAYIESANLKKFPKNCTTVCADPLSIQHETDLTEKQLTNAFKNMKHLIGSLLVTRSKFSSGKFLANLESVDCDNIGQFKWSLNENLTEIGLTSLKSVSCQVEITSNPELAKLNLPNMMPTPSQTADHLRTGVEINGNSPELCITEQEMSNFLSNENNDIGTMPQFYCSALNTNDTIKSCVFENSTLATLETGCVKLKGNVLISENDEEHTYKLESVKDILGSLTIDGTNLTDIDFLDSLENVVALKGGKKNLEENEQLKITENQSAILIQYNPNLANVTFPNLKRAIAKSDQVIIFQNNSQELLMNPSVCWNIRNVLNTSNAGIPTIDGQDCGEY